jgi:hypothetical protein
MITVPTPSTRRRSSRRLDRLNRNAATALQAMRNDGCTLHAEFGQAGLRWRMSKGRFVSNEVAKIIITDKHVIGVGDTLFADGPPSQTWRYAEECGA